MARARPLHVTDVEFDERRSLDLHKKCREGATRSGRKSAGGKCLGHGRAPA